MKISIRTFLLVNLLLAILITTSLTAIGNYYLDKKDIQHHLDTIMSITTNAYQALIGNDINRRNLTQIQQELTTALSHPHPSEGLTSQFKLQVWDDKGKLLLHSPTAPTVRLSKRHEGFSDEIINGEPWRVYVTYNRNAKTTTILGERYDNRRSLGRAIMRDDIVILLLIFPLSGLLIWFIIGSGLHPLKRVAKAVANRAHDYLEPVNIKRVPTEIAPLVDELNKLFLRLKQAFTREKRFAADAAHELPTQLATLKTQAQVAVKAKTDEQRDAALKNLVKGVDRSTHVVQQLLTLSRLVSQESYMRDYQHVNLNKLCTQIIADLAPSAFKKNIEISLNVTSKKITIHGNETALGILIRNLVDNAIRYTPEEGKIVVDIDQKKQRAILRVTDNGPGIPVELRTRVFERFFRVLGHEATGTGLGLSIVHQIANLQNAEVNLGEPEHGSGLQVEINFPEK